MKEVFRPQADHPLSVDGVPYSIAEHPAAHGMPYGQEGRQATVYKLVSGTGQKALKVFKPRFQVPSLVSLSKRLDTYAEIPGLRVCRRMVLTPQHNSELLAEHPDLLYSVLMPWIEGPTWMEVIISKRVLTPDQSLQLVRALANVLSIMEQEGLAHCDLSGPNLLLPALADDTLRPRSAGETTSLMIELVDVEQMYGPELRRPEVLPSGSMGYAHKTAADGLWSSEADRFAGGVLIAEMLGWCDPRVRDAAWGEGYFDPSEMQRANARNARYNALDNVLRERWGEQIVPLFRRVWESTTVGECPTFGAWLVQLTRLGFAEPRSTEPPIASVRPAIVLPMIETTERRTVEPITKELAVPETLARPTYTHPDSRPPSPRLIIAPSMDIHSAPTPSTPPTPVQSPKEQEAAELLADGYAAFARGEWMQARELLTAVMVDADALNANERRELSRRLAEVEKHIRPKQDKRALWIGLKRRPAGAGTRAFAWARPIQARGKTGHKIAIRSNTKLITSLQWLAINSLIWAVGSGIVGAYHQSGLVYDYPTSALSFLVVGILIGYGQWLIIRKHIARSGWWIVITAATYSITLALPDIVKMNYYWLGLGWLKDLWGIVWFGLVSFGIVGITQWFFIRRGRWALLWIPANTFGLMLGSLLGKLYKVGDDPYFQPAEFISIYFVSGLFTGLCGGLISGFVLFRILKEKGDSFESTIQPAPRRRILSAGKW